MTTTATIWERPESYRQGNGVEVWCSGFGLWIARVSANVKNPKLAARKAILREVAERENSPTRTVTLADIHVCEKVRGWRTGSYREFGECTQGTDCQM